MNQPDIFTGPKRNWFPTGNRELVFGLLTLALGLFGANMVAFGGFALGFALAAVLSTTLTWIWLRLCGHKADVYTRILLLLSAIIAAGFAWSSDAFVKAVLLLFLLCGTNLSFCLMASQNRRPSGYAGSLLDAGRSLFMLGIGKSDYALRGIGNAFRTGSEATRRGGAVLTGLAMAIPALALVIPLLISSDAAFEGLVDLLPDFDLWELSITVFWGSLLGIWLYSRGTALVHAEPESPAASSDRKGLSPLTMNTALGTVCAVYLAYLFSQLAYFVGGFSGILPEGFTAAEYARRGFFEMAALVVINLCVIIFGAAKVSRPNAGTRGLCLFLGLVSEFLVASGAAKMVLYIDLYGLTRLRVLTMVIMVFLAVTTAAVCVWLYQPKLQYMKLVLITALTLGAAVLWLDVDTQVAKYNVEHYLSGDLAQVDMDHLLTLGPGAVPYIEELTDCADPTVSLQAEMGLRRYNLYAPADFRGMTAKTQQALEILEQYP